MREMIGLPLIVSAGLIEPALMTWRDRRARVDAAGIAYHRDGAVLTPMMEQREKRRIITWWKRRRRMGKPLNVTRLIKASTTFDGAARYAAWKIERHTGVPITITPFREKHPVLAAPGVWFSLWREKRKRGG